MVNKVTLPVAVPIKVVYDDSKICAALSKNYFRHIELYLHMNQEVDNRGKMKARRISIPADMKHCPPKQGIWRRS